MKRKNKLWKSFHSQEGVILPIVIIMMVALTITGIAFLNAGLMENSMARRENHKNQAFYLAEAGLDRTLWNLKQDFENGDKDWTNGDINGIPVDGDYSEKDGASPDEWGVLDYDNSSLGPGSYEVLLHCMDESKIWVRSTGTVKDVSRTVQVYVRIGNISPWNNAIFAGTGQSGRVINGNVKIHGSVLVLGEDLSPEDLAMDMSGNAGMRNNYDGMPSELADLLPPCPTTMFNGEEVESLDAVLRVKQGKLGLSGTATLGEQDTTGNFIKETVDAVYVNHGYGGNQGESNVYSDNGTQTPYDLGDLIEFPSLRQGPYVDNSTESSHLEYLNNHSVHITRDTISSDVEEFSAGEPGGNYIHWNPDSNTLRISGIVFVEGNSLDIGKKKETITYVGTGTIVVAHPVGIDGVEGTIQVHGDLIADADAGGFPQNSLGLISGNIDLAPGESQRKMTGIYFAENQIVSQKQNEIAGTFVSNYFDMGQQVPRIYQVPGSDLNLPPGMPGFKTIWNLTISQWSEL